MKKFLSAAIPSVSILVPSTTFAHHPLGGLPMESFFHGILSGIAHPLLGFDHLFFVALVGVAALFTGRKYVSPIAYIVAMLVGCILMSAGIGLPIKEVIVGFSLLGLGAIVISGKALGFLPSVLVFFTFGLFHGSALGDTIATQEMNVGGEVLIGYLIGLGAIQYTVSIAAGWVLENMFRATEPKIVEARLAGAIAAGAGLVLTIENIELFAFNLMGWVS